MLTSPSYVDTTAVNGTAYSYVVVAVDTGALASPASATVSATPSANSASGLQLNGTSQYVTFGAAPEPRRDDVHARDCGSGAPAAGVGTSTGTGGIASAIPLVTKGGAEAETPANVNMNYFLGIDATQRSTRGRLRGARRAATTRSAARPS